MLSANEEYQSTNEELESAKEELQSANEELTTTIEELRNRNRDLGALNADVEQARFASEAARTYADTIIETVRFPLAVIDSERRIKRMNRAFVEDLEISPETAESVLNDDARSSPWNIPALREKLKLVIREGRPMDDFEVDTESAQSRPSRVGVERKEDPRRWRARPSCAACGGRCHRSRSRRGRSSSERPAKGRIPGLCWRTSCDIRSRRSVMRFTYCGAPRWSRQLPRCTRRSILETRRLERFVNDLLDVVRVDRGLLNITRGRVDLVDVVQRGAAAVQPLIELHNHVLKLVLDQRAHPHRRGCGQVRPGGQQSARECGQVHRARVVRSCSRSFETATKPCSAFAITALALPRRISHGSSSPSRRSTARAVGVVADWDWD